MGRKEKAGDGNRSHGLALGAEGGGDRGASMAAPQGRADQAGEGNGDSLTALVEYAGRRGDGWFRVVPALTGEVHWKWRFTSGRWAGRYVYWCQGKYDTAVSGAAGLVSKLGAVDRGTLIPSPDIY